MMKTRKRMRIRLFAVCLLLILTGFGICLPKQASASGQAALNLDQIEQKFARAIKEGEQKVTFTAPAHYSTAQIQNALDRAAKSQNRILAGSVHFQKQTNSASTNANYTIQLSKDALKKIKRLKSESAAVKAAAKALKHRKYSTNYYSDTSYYPIFVKMLQQHPEYNYNTVVWRNTNGTFGYHRGDALSKQEQEERMKAADKAAKEAVEQCIKPDMTEKQKAKAIHNYLIRTCSYNEQAAAAGNKYDDAFTAYGALVDGSAVCQGYAAAFNLMAKKCGLASMTVCGKARGISHAWTYAKLDGKNRYIDCTWDDTDGEKIRYEYFYVKEKKMREQHVWNAADFPAGDIKYSKYF